MTYRIALLAVFLISQIDAISQDSLAVNPLERALSGVLTVAVFDVDDEDQVLGFAEKDKAYADIAYEKTLDMTGAYSNGSGFVIEYQGKYYVLTNAHVIDAASGMEGAINAFSITRRQYSLKLVGGDSFYDLALLEFDGVTPGSEIQPLELNPEEVQLAQKVYAIGNPLGTYPYSITEGIISGKNRLFQRPSTGRFGFLQHTATLIWGNSGGPLVDEQGRVVGINTWIATRQEENRSYIFSQLNFALEGRRAAKLVQEMLENGGRVRRPFLGVAIGSRYGDFQSSTAPFLTGVMAGSPAAEMLQERIGYPIVSINGAPVTTLQDAVRLLEESEPGQPIALGFKKGIISRVDTVQSDELTERRLEDIARYFFQAFTDYQVLEDEKGVRMEGKQQRSYHRLELITRDTTDPAFAAYLPIQGAYQYGMAGMGAIEENGAVSPYRVGSLRDLGAIIRLCALEGNLGARLLDEQKQILYARFFMVDQGLDQVKVLMY